MIVPYARVEAHRDNLGLTLSKLIPTQTNKDPSKKGDDPGKKGDDPGKDGAAYSAFVRELAQARPSAHYAADFRRWQRFTAPGPETRRVLRLQAQSSVLVGMGEPTPGENGLSHHHSWGVPLLPGSSLKGVCRAWCVQHGQGEWAPGKSAFRLLFGHEATEGQDGEGGSVDFLDALPEPDTLRWVAEILTPHHADYYQGQGQVPPQGLKGPNPVTFLGATATWRLVLEGPRAWLDAATELLRLALRELGVGAKTRAGYGRLVVSDTLDAVDLRRQQAWEEQHFDTWPFEQQLRLLRSRGVHEQAIEQGLRAWAQDKPPQVALLTRLHHEPAREAAAARWLRDRGLLTRLRKKPEDRPLLEILEAWLRAGEAAEASRAPATPEGSEPRAADPSAIAAPPGGAAASPEDAAGGAAVSPAWPGAAGSPAGAAASPEDTAGGAAVSPAWPGAAGSPAGASTSSPPGTDAAGSTPSAGAPAPRPSAAFGERPFTPPTLPSNDKKRDSALNDVSAQLARGGFSPAAVQEGVAFLRAHGAKEGTIKRVLRAYGLEDAP